jgi:APA family basic amino acid/polyamine antiporter
LAGAAICLLQMLSLPWETWERLLIWMAIGLVIYFSYSRKKSKLAQ